MQPANANLTWWQNVNFALLVAFVDQNGQPHDFSGSTFAMHVKADPAGAVVVAVTIDDTEAEEGVLGLSFAGGALAVGDYVYDLVRINGGLREPLMYGSFSMLQGVTQP